MLKICSNLPEVEELCPGTVSSNTKSNSCTICCIQFRFCFSKRNACFCVRAFLLNHDFGFISSVFGLPAPVSVVFREGLSLQGGKIIEESDSSDNGLLTNQ